MSNSNWESVLWKWDFYGTKGSQPPFDRVNILLRNLRETTSDTYEAELLDVAGVSSASVLKDFLLLSADEHRTTVTVKWTSSCEIPPTDMKFFCPGS